MADGWISVALILTGQCARRFCELVQKVNNKFYTSYVQIIEVVLKSDFQIGNTIMKVNLFGIFFSYVYLII
jgi:hypothetical protein